MDRKVRIEHPPPTDATVKQMYAVAFQCAHPKCARPLYRVDDVNGELTLNSTVAHIHARREDGPRWLTTMTDADNRAEPNLVLLCLEHSSEVDRLEDDYPPDEMRAWKVAVRAAYDEYHRGWTLTTDRSTMSWRSPSSLGIVPAMRSSR